MHVVVYWYQVSNVVKEFQIIIMIFLISHVCWTLISSDGVKDYLLTKETSKTTLSSLHYTGVDV